MGTEREAGLEAGLLGLALEPMIEAANGEADPTLCNLKITLAHRRLSERLQAVTGPEVGANFHSWAVWGSKKAGVTIRQEDLDGALVDASRAAGAVGAGVGLGCMGLILSTLGAEGAAWAWMGPGALLGAACGAPAGRALARWSRRRASALVLAGNRLVLDDIGRQTARFCERFEPEVEAGRSIPSGALAAFLDQMDARPAEAGGQALLKRAFAQYARAADRGLSLEARQQAAYFANCLAILNEHIKLQPYIVGAMPFIVQRCVTQRMLTFEIGALALSVRESVPPLRGRAFPAGLERLIDPELEAFLHGAGGWARRADSLAESGAGNWARLSDRMAYIVALFRCFHLDGSVLAPPYGPEQAARIVAGQIPAGRL